MSYLSKSAIAWSIKELKTKTHPFLGITFLACKKANLPVGETARTRLDKLTRDHLRRHHRLDSKSEYIFQPFRSRKFWVRSNYASTGLQAVNTQTFADIFLHDRGNPKWGFVADYVHRISSRLRSQGLKPTSLEAIALWIAKNRDLDDDTSIDMLVDEFLDRYSICRVERRELFLRSGKITEYDDLLQEAPADLRLITHGFAPPPDAEVPAGALCSVCAVGVGPAEELRLDIGERLTVVAGDNGLGKSFLLDVAWWATTGTWAMTPVKPTIGFGGAPEARIDYNLQMQEGVSRCFGVFDSATQSWVVQNESPRLPSLNLYARVDGSFSVADDRRMQASRDGALHLASSEVFDGKPGTIEGLLRDVARWQLSNEPAFGLLQEVLGRLSPPDLGVLRFAEPSRQLGDPRPIPTIRHPYGDVPVPQTSAGVRRALALAYMIVWLWQEHRWTADQVGFAPVRRLMLFVDEIEAHLHPFWQRTILPAVLAVVEQLGADVEIQAIVSTHSPLVLASLEPRYCQSTDRILHLRLEGSNVSIDPHDYRRLGDVSTWLTSDVIGLQAARSIEGEAAIRRAMELQAGDTPDQGAVEAVSRELLNVLGSDDPFWRRWVFFARQMGVVL